MFNLIVKFVFLSLFYIYTLNAATNSDIDELFDMSLEELMNVKIVGSTRTPETLTSVPSAVSVYSAEEIKLMGVRTLEELMNYVPGFSSVRSGDSGYRNVPTVRSKRSGATGKEILVIIDGQRLNSDFSGSAFVFNNQIPVANFQRVEFIRGPGSSLYGSNAFMGIINIVTLQDKKSFSAAIGSYGAKESHLNYSFVRDNLKLNTYVMHSSNDGESYTNLFNFNEALPKVSTKDPFERDEIYINANYKRFSLQSSLRKTEASKFYGIGTVNNDINRHDMHGGFVRFSYDGTGQSVLNSKISIGYRDERSDLDFTVRPEGIFLPHSNDPSILLTTLEGHELDIKIDNTIYRGNGDTFLFGAEYRHPKTQKLSVSTNFNMRTGEYAGGFNSFSATSETYRTIYGLYGQYQKDLTQNLSLTVGLRYDHYSDFGTAFSPRLGVVYDNFSGRVFKLLYAEAFRAPAREENDLVHTGILMGNRLLDPEITKTVEAIWIEKLTKNTFTLTLFNSKIKDAIFDVTDGFTGQRTVQNGTENYSGFEAELLSDVTSELFLRSSFSAVTNSEEAMFRNVSKSGSFSLNWHNRTFNSNIHGIYHGSSEGDFGGKKIKFDNFFEFGANFIYKMQSSLELFLNIKNLFDEKYMTPFEGVSHPDGVVGRGRRVLAGVSYRF